LRLLFSCAWRKHFPGKTGRQYRVMRAQMLPNTAWDTLPSGVQTCAVALYNEA
jgi:hypothetical protein